MVQFIAEMGGWGWIIFGLVLLGLEILAPGTFFLWFGLSAMAIGAVSLLLGPDHSVWVWQFQLLVFLGLSLLTAYFGRRLMANRGWDHSEIPNLNERADTLVGRQAVLIEPIKTGRGRAKIGDTVWQVSGEELKAGTEVKVVGHRDGVLEVVQEPPKAD